MKERKHIEHKDSDFPEVFDIDKYMSNLNARSVIYTEKLGSILTLSVNIEFLLEEIILKYYLGGMRKEKKIHFRDSFLERAPFPTKVDLLKRIFEDKGIYPGKYKKGIIRELGELNTIRNDFAHHTLVPEDTYSDDKIEYLELGKGLSEDRKHKLMYGTIIKYSIKEIEKKEQDFFWLRIHMQVIFWDLSKRDPMDGHWPEQIAEKMKDKQTRARKRAGRR